ncbi:Hypothetical protein R9X50_00055000 [Acrodontium crateriforme]|uniref:Biogenesis of lysosome-related organelles complex 1 subunit CNL1 n=1 Tax=Acrodontium crateriforme TaxID=150365 RepID=A0AAQ3LZ01_9PEZI|nr:Hypothetical protein R9X50_00055000 [Acrodontium crateriforme]
MPHPPQRSSHHHRAPRPPSSSASASGSTSTAQRPAQRPPPQHHAQQQQQARPSAPSSIPDTGLGLTAQEIQTLRQHQQAAHNQARSSAGSQASSQGRLLLDPASLNLLARHFDQVLQSISGRLEQLDRAMAAATETQHTRVRSALQAADDTLARLRLIEEQSEELENEFAKIGRLREIVRSYRARVAEMERRLG